MSDTTEEPMTLEMRAADLARRLEEMEISTTARLVRAELKAAAIRAGMVDLDGLKLVDMTGLTLSEQGEVPGAEGLMSQMRRSKPWLFGAFSSSSPATPPAPPPPGPKNVSRMNHSEWQAARAEILKRP